MRCRRRSSPISSLIHWRIFAMSAILSNDQRTADMLCALADFIRYNVQTLARTTLGRELENARQYLNIFSLRHWRRA